MLASGQAITALSVWNEARSMRLSALIFRFIEVGFIIESKREYNPITRCTYAVYTMDVPACLNLCKAGRISNEHYKDVFLSVANPQK